MEYSRATPDHPEGLALAERLRKFTPSQKAMVEDWIESTMPPSLTEGTGERPVERTLHEDLRRDRDRLAMRPISRTYNDTT